MKKLENKVAIITGAASGLGKAIAILYASQGARVIAADCDEPLLKLLEKDVADQTRIRTIKADMTIAAEVEGMIKYATDSFGTLDVLVNNAGVMDDFSPVGQVTDANWDRVMKVNVEGPMRAMRSALQIMLPKKSGVIINVASIGGLQGGRAGAVYTTSKHALIGLTVNTGYMYSKSGVRCVAIAPGAMNTNIARNIDFSKLPAAPLFTDRIAPGLALNPRTSDPQEVAHLAVFLASDEASFINATAIVADGGWTGF